MSLTEALAERRSHRAFRDQPLDLGQISQLLWAAQGITGKRHGHELRTAPSAGACFPLEVDVITVNGVSRYRPDGHVLVPRFSGDIRAALVQAAWDQEFLAEAPCTFAISAVYERTTQRYGPRGRDRYVPMDAGHAAENLLLQATALGLVSVPVGAFGDDAIARLLRLPPDETPLYLLPVGYSR
ncbi:MAG TPA: SagB/ThcOx family dehydrogenase [Anaerolineae bacterium]|nr:SagB/ThcOx family dehydrogenase [Anaerolineae bacterium]